MKILVTGGAGFIGTNLCNELRSRGNNVVACDLYNTDRDDYIRCDVRNYRQIERVFVEYGPFDYVFYAAALKQGPSCEFFPVEAVRTNILGTENVFDMRHTLWRFSGLCHTV
ncbi:MAG: polysaccharide biosynthesis protein [Thermodesulfobacteriota bacterium]|nr:polysaccharide biosynthesis protein [Thermodesulfobacteriota bacterium]